MSKLTIEQILAWLLDTTVNNRAKNCNPYSRPGVKQALAWLNERAKGEGEGELLEWSSEAWKTFLPDEVYTEGVSVNPDDKLYVIQDSQGYYTCMGFDKVTVTTTGYAVEMKRADLMPWKGDYGTLKGYAHFRRVQDEASKYASENGYRFTLDLTPQLIGLEGKRVEVVDWNGETRRFIVGKSTGWCPCHLEIPRKGASGGGGVFGAPFQSVKVLKS